MGGLLAVHEDRGRLRMAAEQEGCTTPPDGPASSGPARRKRRPGKQRDLDRQRQWRREYVAVAANRERVSARHLSWRHGAGIHAWLEEMWEAQRGLCYLCERPMSRESMGPARAFIDHDHSCCPQGRSCAFCRRGLACERCNFLIGHVSDDPELLCLIAANLTPILAETRARIAAKPVQLEMVAADEGDGSR